MSDAPRTADGRLTELARLFVKLGVISLSEAMRLDNCLPAAGVRGAHLAVMVDPAL